jgi:hypothetical protein
MIRRTVLIFAAVATVGIVGPAAAQQAGVNATAAPAAGTAQRRAILDALRPTIARRVGPNVEFVVHDIRIAQGWAFVNADPQRRGGGRIDGRQYFGEDFDNMDGLAVTALLRFRDGRWNLVDHAIGATDAWYCGRNLTPLVGC